MSRKNRITVQCSSCGADLQLSPCKVKGADKHFCNRRCYADWQSANQRGESNPSWKPRIEIICEACGRNFEAHPSDSDRRYCSKECADIGKGGRKKVQCHWCDKVFERQSHHAERQERHFCDYKCMGEWQSTQTGENARSYKGAKVEAPCSQCGKPVMRGPEKLKRNNNFFCSGECWNTWRSIHMQREGNPNWTEPVKTQCATCGTPIERNPSRVGVDERKVHFCSKPCKYQWMSENLSGENNHLWKGGSIAYYGPNWHRQRRRARKRDGYRCQHCGIAQKKNGKALDVHHIVPFRTFGYIPGQNDNYKQANDLSNLVSLCRSCHIRAERGAIPVQPNLL